MCSYRDDAVADMHDAAMILTSSVHGAVVRNRIRRTLRGATAHRVRRSQRRPVVHSLLGQLRDLCSTLAPTGTHRSLQFWQ